MGELTDRIVKIHKNQINLDKENFKNEITKINTAIIKSAEFGNTKLEIHFSKYSPNIITYANTSEMYNYYLKTLLSVNIIKSYISNYYKEEKIYTSNSSNYVLCIDWRNILNDELKEE